MPDAVMKDDLREVVAHTILTEILRQDSTSPAKMGRDLLWPWLDQGEVDFGAVADAAIAAARPVIEREATAAVVAYLRDDNGRCDCSARSAGECACGAWDDYKQLPLGVIADRIERNEHLPAKPLDT